MKKVVVLLSSLIIAALLVACGSAAAGTTSGSTTSATTTNGLPLASELALGTLNLESTGQAVSTEQAKALLPLWQALLSLSSSSTAAPAETEAVLKQIQSTLTEAQMTAISDMKLTPADVQTYFSQQGFGPGAGGAANGSNASSGSTSGSSSGGGFPAGGPPDGGGGPPGGGPPGGGVPGVGGTSLTAEQQATREAQRASMMASGTDPVLLNAVIRMLEGK